METYVEIFAWPLMFLILGLVIFFNLKKPIYAFFDRLKRIDARGVALDAPPQEPTEQLPETQPQEDLFGGAFDNSVLLTQEQAIQADPQVTRITDPQQKEKFLTRHLAGAQIALHFERVYRYIFGSQIKALQFLTSLTEPIPKNVVKTFYDTASTLAPEFYLTKDFESWLEFLRDRANLVKEEDEKITIQPLGREFLKYLIDNGISDYRPH